MAKSKFQKTIEAIDDVSSAYKSGLQALKTSERGKVIAVDPSLLDGSVDIDLAVKKKYPAENRWDYAFGYSGKVCYVEVHPAYTSEVTKFLQKLNWLKNWLKLQAPELNSIPKLSPGYVWVYTKKAAILPQSTEARKIAQAGVKLVSVHKLQ